MSMSTNTQDPGPRGDNAGGHEWKPFQFVKARPPWWRCAQCEEIVTASSRDGSPWERRLEGEDTCGEAVARKILES